MKQKPVTLPALIIRNLFYHKKKQLGVILGVILSTAILTGALIIGDSVRYSLDQMVLMRLGKTQFALTSGDRFFRQELATSLTKTVEFPCTPVVQTTGIAISVQGDQTRLNHIQCYGINKTYGQLASKSSLFEHLSDDEIIISSNIALKLDLAVGDDLILRFRKLQALPIDSPLSADDDLTVARRFKVQAIADENHLGRFSLKGEQIPPFNVFISLNFLANLMNIPGKANMILALGESEGHAPSSEPIWNDALKNNWTLADAGITIKTSKNGTELELRSDRIFLDPFIVSAAEQGDLPHQKVLTYFVNQIRCDKKETPYSFVSALSPGPEGRNLGSNDIILNRWTAEDLNAVPGSTIELTYYVIGPDRKLEPKSHSFRVVDIVPIEGDFADETLMPDFPGLSEKANCMEWQPGIPIDFDHIRKKDENYWNQYHGTPKAFIALETAGKLWENRFGTLTALRFPDVDSATLKSSMEPNLNPESWNIEFRDVKSKGLNASAHSVDFGGLFIGLSFFVILSALLLTRLLFSFTLEARSSEFGLLLALGFSQRTVKKLVFIEMLVLIFIGGAFGSWFSIYYDQLVLLALKTIWVDVIGTSALVLHFQAQTILMGFIIMAVLNLLMLGWDIHKTLISPVHSLQTGIEKLDSFKPKPSRLLFVVGAFSLGLALLLSILINPKKGSEVSGLYFANGFLLLLGCIFLFRAFLNRLNCKQNRKSISLFTLAFKELTRNKAQSSLLITLLASSLFIVFTVGINKKTTNPLNRDRHSGTGGFSFYGETTIPLLESLNDPGVRKKMGIPLVATKDLNFLEFKVKTGDDASCLNLNRVTNPQVIGVKAKDFSQRDAFTFLDMLPEVDPNDPWSSLDMEMGTPDTIPGIADASVIQWQLGKSIGDTLAYRDDAGNPFYIKLVAATGNSIFQGNVLISEKNFRQRFPSVAGTSLFVTESNPENDQKIDANLHHALQDWGVTLSTAADRLALFNRIENTYLSIFLILGSFGVCLGCLGVGIVLYRQVQERKSEFALLTALGFQNKKINLMTMSSYSIILILGIGIGILSSFMASLPSLLNSNAHIPYAFLGIIILCILLTGQLAIWISTKSALKGALIANLREE